MEELFSSHPATTFTISLFGKRYVWKDGAYMGWYRYRNTEVY